MELRKPDNYYGLAWRPSLLYRLDCQGGGVQITNTYFRQQPVNEGNSQSIGHVNIALYVRRWVFILYVGEFLPRRKQFKGNIFRVEVFVSPV